MGIEAIIVILIIVIAVILFATEVISVDLVAILAMVTLILTGILTPEEGIAGFSNQATITVGAMFILSHALFKTGAISILGPKLAKLFRFNFYLGIFFMMVSVGFISAFINNTPVVAIFIPLILKVASTSKYSVSKYLMPLSYASIFGGVCTLIGTSTNLLVSGIAVQNGLPPFSMFLLTPMGLVFFVAGLLYMIFIGVRIIPNRGTEKDLTEKFGIGDYFAEIQLLPNAASVGKMIAESPLVKDYDIDVIEIRRGSSSIFMPRGDMFFKPNDILKVRCNVERIKDLQDRVGITFKPDITISDEDLKSENVKLVEVVIPQNSELEGKTLKQIAFRNRYGAIALAIKHRGEIMREKLSSTPLRTGDVLLLEVRKDRLNQMKVLEARQESPFLIISEAMRPSYNGRSLAIVGSVLGFIVLAATFNFIPIMAGAVAGCVLLIVLRCLTAREAYDAVDWKVIFLLAGSLSLGAAMQKTQVTDLMAYFIINNLGVFGNMAIVSGLYLITSMLTETMSNNASAALIAPIAIVTANALGVDPMPFLMAITFAASASFMTPIGYQTNTMIYSAGQYKFFDFIKVGTPLNIIFWILASLLIPVFYPF